MTNKGTVYNILGSDAVSGDLPSVGNFTTPDWINQSASNCSIFSREELSGYPYAPMIMFIDNPDGDEIEFAVVSGTSTKYLKVYSVSLTGTPAFSLKSNTVVAYTTGSSYNDYFGIVKVSEELYYVYYAVGLNEAPDYDNRLQFRRLEVEPGVGYTDTLLEEIDINTKTFADYPDYGDFGYLRSFVSDNKGYVGTYRRLRDEPFDIYEIQVFLWNVDLETGTVSGGYQGWEIPLTPYAGASDPPFVISKYQDTVSVTSCWATISSSTLPGTFNGYVIIDGVSTLVHTVSNIITRSMWNSHWGKKVHYGTSHYLIEMGWYLTPYVAPNNIYLSAHISEDGIITRRLDDPVGFYPLFEQYNAQGMSFPGFTDIGNDLKLKKDPDDDNYYWVDEYGANDTELSITGVEPSYVYQVFPASNPDTDGIYANVLLTDAIDGENQFLVELAPDLLSIVAYYPHGNLTYHSCFNHGRFFLTWNGSTVYVQYMVNAPVPINKNTMILEFN